MFRGRAPLVLTALVASGLAASQAYAQNTCNPRENARCQEIRSITGRAAVQAALAAVDAGDEQTLRDLVTLTEIPAPPFGEEARGRAFAAMLRDAGADSVWTDSVGNVIALRRGTSGDRTVAIAGHLDTVFPEGTDVNIKQRGDTLYAPGVGDDTRGLVTVLAALRALEAGKVETEADVLFIGDVGEEGLGDLRGMKHLFGADGPGIDAFISVDGSDDARIVHQALGSHRYRITFTGPGGHSWGAFGIANPAHALGRAVSLFDDAANRFTSSGPRTSYNVGRIGGGTSVNSVPFESWMEVDMRSESPQSLAAIDSLLHDVVRQAVDRENAEKRRGEPVTVKFVMVGDRPSGETDPTNPLVQRAQAATLYFGLEPELTRSSTDSNIPISLGIPAITIGGGGRAGNAHALDEWWTNEDGPRGIKRAMLIVLAEAGIPGDAS